MGKCEWKDGKFEGCEGMLNKAGCIRAEIQKGQDIYYFCPFCGADIRKPEPEKPLIVKSGGTFVTEHEEINYLWTEQESPEDIGSIDYDGKWKVHCGWKSFSEIEKEGLTDEIAKLRPMVKDSHSMSLYLLWGVENNLYGIVERFNGTWIGTEPTKYLKLATPHELQEAK